MEGDLLVGPDASTLTAEQIADLRELSPELPTEGREYLIGAGTDMGANYTSGYDAGARK